MNTALSATQKGAMMTRHGSTISRLCIVLWLAVLGPGLLALPLLDGTTECVRARTWAEANAAAGTLPTTYDAFVALPAAYRKAAIGFLDTKVQIHLWRTQLQTALRHDATLTDEQRRGLRELLSGVTVENMVQGRLPSSAEFARAFGDRKELYQLVRRLGPDQGSYATFESTSLLIEEKLRRALTAFADEDGDCSCNSGDGGENWCNIWYGTAWTHCFCDVSMDAGYCTYYEWGCGDWLMQRCNGECYCEPNLE